MLKLNQDTILFIQTQSSPTKRSLKKLQQVYLLASTPSFTTISSLPLICLYMMREVILTSEFFFQKRHLREVNCAQDQLHFFPVHLLPFFFLNPQNPNDHHHQHSQTPNNLPIV